MKRLDFKLSSKKIIFYSYVLISVIITISFFASSFFLYKNFFLSISQSEEVIYLRKQVAIESVDIKKFDDIINKINKKIQPKEFKIVNNPFSGN